MLAIIRESSYLFLSLFLTVIKSSVALYSNIIFLFPLNLLSLLLFTPSAFRLKSLILSHDFSLTLMTFEQYLLILSQIRIHFKTFRVIAYNLAIQTIYTQLIKYKKIFLISCFQSDLLILIFVCCEYLITIILITFTVPILKDQHL